MPNKLFDPLSTRPRQIADMIANMIDDPSSADRGMIKPFIAGGIQGVGDMASDMTSPFSLATAAAGPIASGLGRAAKGVKQVAPVAKRAMSAAVDLGPEFVAPFQQAEYNAKRAKRAIDEAQKVSEMSLKGGTGRAIQPTSSEEVLKFMRARAKSKESVGSGKVSY